MQVYVKAIVNQCIKAIVTHSKYQCPPWKVGDCSQFWFNFLTDKIVQSEIQDIIYTYFKDIYSQKNNIAAIIGCSQVLCKVKNFI